MSKHILTAIDEHVRLVDHLRHQIPLMCAMAQTIIDAIENDHRIYLIGNGGSAADAQHIAAELVGRFKQDRRPLPAIALTTDTSGLLAVGNDFGFAHVFDRQVEAHVRPGDVLWALSTSGTSANVIQAVRTAANRGAGILAFTGRSGGELKPLSHHCLCIDHSDSDRIQEMHVTAYHLICEMVENHFTAE